MSRTHSCSLQARSYELDSFGHVNHAVYLNYFEYARFQALASGGFSPETLAERGEGVHVVRVEVDYRAELRLDEEVRVETRVQEIRRSSMTLRQVAISPSDAGTVYAEASVVVVWIGPDGRPMRVPDDARSALEAA